MYVSRAKTPFSILKNCLAVLLLVVGCVIDTSDKKTSNNSRFFLVDITGRQKVYLKKNRARIV
jgi:hypothetical protein